MHIHCPHCDALVVVPDDAVGTKGACAQCGQTVDVTTAERVGLSAGDELAGCRVTRLVGRGGMAMVYEATQLSLDRPVALKVLLPRLARQPDFVERFGQEAAALSQLSHPNIVHIFHKGCEDGTIYFVMELVEGESLRRRLVRDGPVPFAEAIALIDQVAAGLGAAHARGVLHRDIKPENILIAESGTAKLGDFGIARILGDGGDGSRITKSQRRMGSANYMAPEQARDDDDVGPRADLFALGVTLYEMLTGQLPVGSFPPASSLADGIPRAIDPVLAQALAPEPEARHSDVAAFRAALAAAAAAPAPVRPRARLPRRPARRRQSPSPILPLAAMAILIALAVAAWKLMPPRAAAPPAQPPPARAPVPPPKPAPPAQAPRTPATRAAAAPPPTTAKPSPQPAKPPERPQRDALVFTGTPLTLEAEEPHERVAPMAVRRDPTASGGAFLWEPRGPGQGQFSDRAARAVYYVRTDRERWVQLWARVRTPDDAHNSFFVAVEPGRRSDGDLREWHFAIHDQWTWLPLDIRTRGNRPGRRPTPLRLRPGLNSIIIAARERATPLDRLRIIEDTRQR